MYKNQLQELAQRSCFNLPCYTCIREGPDHAPRFKATVSFNGEVFESPGFYSTLRQAEHAAAEVAITTLSQRGPTQSLAARILDETGVCKNLLQETAQRNGLPLPVYTTIRTGPKHLPLFKCVVEIGGRHFKGEPAKTKKQAEKNAATAAWSALNQSSTFPHSPLLLEKPGLADNREAPGAKELNASDGRLPYQASSSHNLIKGQSRPPVNVRDKNRQFHHCGSLTHTLESANSDRKNSPRILNQLPTSASTQLNQESGLWLVNGKQHLGSTSQSVAEARVDSVIVGHREGTLHHAPASTGSYRRQGRRHQRRHSLSGMESPVLAREAMTASRASAGGSMLGTVILHHQQQQIRGLPYQSLSERFDLKRPSLLEELQQREEDDDLFHADQTTPSVAHRQNLSSAAILHPQGHSLNRTTLQSQSERFGSKLHPFSSSEEIHVRNEDDWHCADSQQGNSGHGKEMSLDFSFRHADRWMRDGVVGDPKCSNQAEGWMRGHLHNQRLDVERGRMYTEGWFESGNSQQQSSEKARDHTLNPEYSYNYGYQDAWQSKEPPSPAMDNDISQHQEHMYMKALGSEKGAHNDGSSVVSSFASPFSSLWSKSAQWWGAHMPSNTASAAAAVANSLGFRPPRTAAPTVKVRQMIPVCSAPPRGADTSGWRHPSQRSPAHLENDTDPCQAFRNLRI
ncbi:hypothetical protein KP509_11G049600 [Ceratopteris richardii]|nr:hypothetical protein KP509_11G049600 [Ceratopteris richardii]